MRVATCPESAGRVTVAKGCGVQLGGKVGRLSSTRGAVRGVGGATVAAPEASKEGCGPGVQLAGKITR